MIVITNPNIEKQPPIRADRGLLCYIQFPMYWYENRPIGIQRPVT